jgi:pimeloyl-ACP methyl ester carboxylesterase
VERRLLALTCLGLVLSAGCLQPAKMVQSLPGLQTPADPLPLADAVVLWPYAVEVAGTTATGLVAVPPDSPRTLVVVAHGWGESSASHRDEMKALAEAGALAVAMDYRGPDAAFKVQAGVEDTVAATLDLQTRWPGLERTFAFGWSMGGEVVLLAAMAAPAGTYDYVFSGAGVTDPAGFWNVTEAARPALESEAGGAPSAVPAAYAARSPVARAAELAGKDVARIVLVHGVADDVVPVEQSLRMAQALRQTGVPTSVYVATRDVPHACATEECAPAPAGHFAGRLPAMLPFLLPRLAGALDPAAPFVEGTYDAAAGTYEPPDTVAPLPAP